MTSYTVQTLTGVVLDGQARFTFDEFCRLCGTERRLVLEMIDEGILDPEGRQTEWRFHGEAVTRARRALRLMHDLRVNVPGAALALDLMDEYERVLNALPAGARSRHSDDAELDRQ